MRREYFTLDVSNVAWAEAGDEPALPTLRVAFEGSASTLGERLEDAGGEDLGADEVDVTFRLQGDPDAPDAEGVVGVTNRVTGDYVLEINAPADEIFPFITAARRYGERTDDDARYRVVLRAEDEPLATFEKRTLLVYADDGELLRGHSLIPSGVEL